MKTHGVFIYIHLDYVLVCGQRIERPSWISRLMWERYWLRVQAL